jgi:hypothetical protein
MKYKPVSFAFIIFLFLLIIIILSINSCKKEKECHCTETNITIQPYYSENEKEIPCESVSDFKDNSINFTRHYIYNNNGVLTGYILEERNCE